MKVIDLLQRIANGEEVPLIKYRDKILHWNEEKDRFEDKDCMNTLYEMDFFELNEEVEIIENKPFNNRVEEIYNRHMDYIYDKKDKGISKDIKWYLVDFQEEEKTKIAEINMNFKILREKIWEIIDKINKEDKQ